MRHAIQSVGPRIATFKHNIFFKFFPAHFTFSTIFPSNTDVSNEKDIPQDAASKVVQTIK